MPLGAAKAAFLGAAGSAGGVEGYTLLSTTTVSTPAQTVTLSAIPQDYRDLKLVIRAAYFDTTADVTWVQLNADSTNTNYRSVYYLTTGSGVATGTTEVGHEATNTYRLPYFDWPYGSTQSPVGRGTLNERQAAEFHIPNYTAVGATSGTGVYCFSSGFNNIGTPNSNAFFQWTGMTWTGATAVTSIAVYAASASFLYQSGTEMSLYGIGTAP
tara:strand:+ start:291 stop:929 length:639 start_codon:yes stop_codon:yes gene_type:complete